MNNEERAKLMMDAMAEGVRRKYPGAIVETETQTQPQFQVGDRFFTHYDMKWGTVQRVGQTRRGAVHGVTGNPLPDTTWYSVVYDDQGTSMLDDAHGNWDMARMVPPEIAKRYGYGSDPKVSA